MNTTWITVGLGLVFAAVLALPFISRKVEHNLEAFLFVMGAIAATISTIWSWELVREALIEPIKITAAVLIAGLVFHYLRHRIRTGVHGIIGRFAFGPFIFLTVVVLGVVSSVISAIIAALVLVEIVSAADMERKSAIRFVVMGCFSIGLGAAMTPLGEPLSTIAIGKLSGEPYHAGFFYLLGVLGKFALPAVAALGLATVVMVGKHKYNKSNLEAPERPEALVHVAVRSGKTYLFVMALVLLGNGFRPLIDLYFSHAPPAALYWANSVSAILDNATLAAAEIGPALTSFQIKAALMGLLISGGALIPGNIPNIICAGKLKITSREWARVGVPVAIVVMAVFFPIVFLLG